MRINHKDLSVMYSNLTIDERNAPLTLKKDESLLNDIIGQSRTAMEVKMHQSQVNRS